MRYRPLDLERDFVGPSTDLKKNLSSADLLVYENFSL